MPRGYPQIPDIHFQTPQKQDNEQYDHQIQSSPEENGKDNYERQSLGNNHVIKNYVMGQKIGQGTFNKVKIARHLLTNQKVAIKIIEKSSIQCQADKKRLQLELKILRKVRHPNIAQLYEILEDKDHLFLVTQHASRGELFDHIISNQKLTEFQACKFLHQILDAIEYIHSLGVVHRDLKPENILLDYKFNVKLIDFGLSNIYSKDELLQTACGSPCYAPPQMLSGNPYNGLRSDIWSVGVVLYAMCFGFLPFDNPNTKQLYQSIREGKYDIPQHASAQLRSILSIILQVDCQKRATIDEIRAHPFCKFSPLRLTPGIIVGLSDIPYEESIEQEIITEIYSQQLRGKSKQAKEQLKKKLKYSIKFNKHNELSATYYLMLHRNLRVKNQILANYYIRKNNQVNRYSIAEKLKLFYDKRLELNRIKNINLQKTKTSKQQTSQQKSKPPNQNAKSSRPNKKQPLQVIQLYNNTAQKQNINQERRLKTTNTKRRKQAQQTQTDKIFKKTQLNFNQIQLQQKNIFKHTPQKRKNLNHQKKLIQRERNKSLGLKTPIQHRDKSSTKKLKKSQQKSINQTKINFSEKKKRSKSHAFEPKKFTMKTERKSVKPNQLQRKQNMKKSLMDHSKSSLHSGKKTILKSPFKQRQY